MEKQASRDNVDAEQEARIKSMYGIESFLNDKTGYDLEISVYEPTANIAGFLSGYTDAGVKTKRHGADIASCVNYDVRPDNPLSWEAIQDTFDGLGFDRRLSAIVRELGYGAILTSDYGVCIMGDIYKRFGSEAARSLVPVLRGRDSVPIVIALNAASLTEIR